ncbi:MAG: ABC transporter permease, partial [Myxococcota bacterium]|nr:ABC transporter permease [Myxococcota bacterium]
KASEPALVPAIIEAIEAQGFRVDKRAERTRDILMTLILFGGSLGLLILALAGLNITHSFFAQLSERKREFAVMRAVGARKRDIVGLVLWQATLLGLLGGLLGAVAAHGIAWGLDGLALRWLPEFPFRPDSFFELPLWGDGLALLAAVLAAVLGALWPALRAGRASIVRLFAEL